jgi:3-phosphoshikimate 1-carboxyvinyltransferase
MGVKINPLTLTLSPKGRGKGEGEIYPPLRIQGSHRLKPISYKSKIASAQVKSCILLAGLYADGVTSVAEPVKSRDHTERMLKCFGARLAVYDLRCAVKGPVKLKSPGEIEIPGDISSAAFFIAAGCVLPDTKIIIKNVGLNPTRTGVLDILKKMGADIRVMRHASCVMRGALRATSCEPSGDIIVKSSKLKGVNISPKEVTSAIDEIPIIMVAACFAKGRTIIKGIEELRVKETDRVHSMVTNLRKIGADIQTGKKIIVINGGRPLTGARVSSFGDHRTAMSMLVAGLGTKGRVTVTGLKCINKSFPDFQNLLNKLN